MNDARIAKIDMQLRDQSPNIFQPEFDPEALKAVKPGERLLVGDRLVSRRADPLGLARPCRSAPPAPFSERVVKFMRPKAAKILASPSEKPIHH